MNFHQNDEVEIFPEPLSGVVEVAIIRNQPGGRVAALSSFWKAKLYHPDAQATVLPGEAVSVVGIQGITLLVVRQSRAF